MFCSALKKLHIHDLPSVRHAPHIRLLLEEAMPWCTIEGPEYTDVDTWEDPADDSSAFSEYEENLKVTLHDHQSASFLRFKDFRTKKEK